MKKSLLILILFITSCGYQPIYLNQNLKELEFSKITLEGNKDVNRKMINSLPYKENKLKGSLNELLLKTSFIVDETSKNSKGQVVSYKSRILVTLKVSKDEKESKSKNFSREFIYNNKANKFELVEYQAEIKNNLINKVIEEIILYMNL